MEIKKCSRCRIEKEFNEFNKLKSGKFGLSSHCKLCQSKYDYENREKFLSYHKEKRSKELEKFKIYDKKYKSENREKQNLYRKNKWKKDINFRIKDQLSGRIHFYLKKHSGKTDKTLNYLGCSISFYKEYLESLFLPQFNWGNYGVVWEIDHIKPISSFDLTKNENIYKAFNYKNTRPLFKTTEIAESFGYQNQIGNRNKGNKL
jgi:hypothetical protein